MTKIMRKAGTILQRLFGVLLVLFAGMGVFGWNPPLVSPRAQPVWEAIVNSGYILPVVTGVYALAGICLIADRFAPLAGILLMPVSLNILLFHSFLNPSSIPFAAAFFAGNCLILLIHRESYMHLLNLRR